MINKPTALIIEDSPAIAELFSFALQEAGYAPEITSTGIEAQTWLERMVPDLVLLDLHLPYVSGNQLLKQIRDDKRLESTVVFITSQDAVQSSYLQNEADLVLNKPISFSQLRDLSIRFRQVNG